MRAALHVAERFPDLLEGKHPVHDGAEFVQGDGTVHRFEHFARADIDSLDAYVFHQNGQRIYFAGSSRENTDQADAPAHPDSPEGLRQRAGAAYFNDVIDAYSAR